jgi:hypothetical protein
MCLIGQKENRTRVRPLSAHARAHLQNNQSTKTTFTPPPLSLIHHSWCCTDMGTAAAERSAEQGADSFLAPCRKHAKGGASVNGTFPRDGEANEW